MQVNKSARAPALFKKITNFWGCETVSLNFCHRSTDFLPFCDLRGGETALEIVCLFCALRPGGIFPFFAFGLSFLRDVTHRTTCTRLKIIFLLSLVSLLPPRDDTTDDHLPENALVLVHIHVFLLIRDASSRRLCSSRIFHVQQNDAQESGYDDDDDDDDDDDESFSRFRSDQCRQYSTIAG